MNEINYDKEMEKIILSIPDGEKPKLLLHCCCAPCSSACIERLKERFDLTVYFYNPNMDSEKEFLLRASEQKRLCENLNIPCVIEDYLAEEFYNGVLGLEQEPEGGARCEKCFRLRLGKTAEFAKLNGYEFFATTLTVSPLKNATVLNREGERAGKEWGVKYLPSDFKKKGGYQRSIELCREYQLYRQNYCGCKFSKK